MSNLITYFTTTVLTLPLVHGETWVTDSQEEWNAAITEKGGLTIKDGMAAMKGQKAHFKSSLQRYPEKRSAQSLTITQSVEWHNWDSTKILPENLGDAPIALSFGPQDHWVFGRYYGKKEQADFKAEKTSLEGYDVPLMTTPYANQFNAPGGLVKSAGGYHAWQSKDLKTWIHHGAVTNTKAKWATTAEQVDGKLYIYYDFPNDQDPHLFIDEDLTDGVPGKDMGMAFKDPSHGSDCAMIRDLEGNFHVIYEDWSPINASKHSWDSPLGGHAVSKDGKGGFKITSPAVDERTTPTGKFAEYPHPHWHAEDPENYPGKVATEDVPQHRVKKGDRKEFAKYEIHEPAQDAYGDWAAISIGGQYYLFADYHRKEGGIKLGWFTSSSINEKFTLCGELGDGHPDPDIMFADGKFYLLTQIGDYVSYGPWVPGVEVRVGVDTTNDGVSDQWTEWSKVQESYDYVKGFSKQVAKKPAQLDLTALPAGYGFQYEVKLKDVTKNDATPKLDKITLQF